MINKSIDPESLENDPNQEKFYDEKTGNKVHQHLSDPYDLISEEDIMGVRTDVGQTTDPGQILSEKVLETLENEKAQNKMDDKEDDHSIISSWNILDI